MSLSKSNSAGGLLGETTQKQITKMLPICPLCGSHAPSWSSHYRVDLFDGRIQFRCSACGSVLSITQTDLLGVYKLRNSNSFLVRLYTKPLIAAEAVKKRLKGKQASTVYVKIDALGFIDETPLQKGEEVPLEYLQQMANNFR